MGPWSTMSQETVGALPRRLVAQPHHGFCGSRRGPAAEAVGAGVLGSGALSQRSAEMPESLLPVLCTQRPLPGTSPESGVLAGSPL